MIPLRPGRHGLTVWIRKAWDETYRSANRGQLIYEDVRGPLCDRPYRLFQTLPASHVPAARSQHQLAIDPTVRTDR